MLTKDLSNCVAAVIPDSQVVQLEMDKAIHKEDSSNDRKKSFCTGLKWKSFQTSEWKYRLSRTGKTILLL